MHPLAFALLLSVRGEPHFLVKPKPRNPLPLPQVGRIALWEAEEAKRGGRWDLRQSPWASGRVYVKAGEEGAALEFVFETPEEVSLKVWPVWWRHGERRPPHQFPWPLELRVGPKLLTVCKRKLFFAAPASGRVGVIDCETEELLKPIEVGGFVSDSEATEKAVCQDGEREVSPSLCGFGPFRS